MPAAKTPKKTPTYKPSTKFMWIIIVVLALTCSTMLLLLSSIKNERLEQSVSLGMMRYHFTGGRMMMRDDSAVASLDTFLNHKADTEGCSTMRPAYEHVVAYTKDETQALIKYGCGGADAPMYIVKTNGEWRTISPTNHFDAFDIPDCAYVASNNISKEIAPVCVDSVSSAAPAYTVR